MERASTGMPGAGFAQARRCAWPAWQGTLEDSDTFKTMSRPSVAIAACHSAASPAPCRRWWRESRPAATTSRTKAGATTPACTWLLGTSNTSGSCKARWKDTAESVFGHMSPAMPTGPVNQRARMRPRRAHAAKTRLLRACITIAACGQGCIVDPHALMLSCSLALLLSCCLALLPHKHGAAGSTDTPYHMCKKRVAQERTTTAASSRRAEAERSGGAEEDRKSTRLACRSRMPRTRRALAASADRCNTQTAARGTARHAMSVMPKSPR